MAATVAEMLLTRRNIAARSSDSRPVTSAMPSWGPQLRQTPFPTGRCREVVRRAEHAAGHQDHVDHAHRDGADLEPMQGRHVQGTAGGPANGSY
jgi:hypothetical protein